MSGDPSGTGGNGADDPPKPPAGRWIGAVRSWIGGTEEGDAPASSGGGTAAPAPAAASPTLTAEEVRRRRLEKMEGSKSQQAREVTFIVPSCLVSAVSNSTSDTPRLHYFTVSTAVADCVSFICIWAYDTCNNVLH